jgi:hypothetical protein
MKQWKCRCGHEVHAHTKPEPICWTDGHVCYFYEVLDENSYVKTEDDPAAQRFVPKDGN